VAIGGYGSFAIVQLAANDWSELTSGEQSLIIRLSLAGLWLTPGVFAFLGGTASYVTYRLVTPKAISDVSARLESGDYRVVAGRLTTVAPASEEG
jgi:hypothetical protein